jgi:hypothetical protein
MRQTPRNLRSQRGIGTLIGNGWLRESPRNVWPGKWDARGKSALRKCMFLPVPDEIRKLAPPQVSPAALPPAAPRPLAAQDVDAHRHDPKKDVRQFPVAGGLLAGRPQQPAPMHKAYPQHPAPKMKGADATPPAWWEDPVALGSLLILAPPIGLAAVWSSKRYSTDARWALTVMTALTMCLISAVVIAGIAMR